MTPYSKDALKKTFTRGDYTKIPYQMKKAIIEYVVEKRPPGSFLVALISNDLAGAIGYADDKNIKLLKLYVQWFYNNTSGLFGRENYLRHTHKVFRILREEKNASSNSNTK